LWSAADLSLAVARRGSAHAVIQPMARRRRRTSLMNYFPQMLIRVSAAATPLLPATIERHELKSGGSIAYYTCIAYDCWVDRR